MSAAEQGQAGFGGHCGRQVQCPSKCACGDEVRAEHEKAAQTAVIARLSDSVGAVRSGVIRRLLGPQIEETGNA